MKQANFRSSQTVVVGNGKDGSISFTGDSRKQPAQLVGGKKDDLARLATSLWLLG